MELCGGISHELTNLIFKSYSDEKLAYQENKKGVLITVLLLINIIYAPDTILLLYLDSNETNH